ncbi:MAG TPA: YhcN/YlaJ family sporulation lipoprotein [Pseudogracilibacillus sp.]|nr:YhcN/YlaJ family sporulation lipoprotein [Pseudogracilibacillus sp.]
MKKVIAVIFSIHLLVACTPNKPEKPNEAEMAPVEQARYEQDGQTNNTDIANHLAEIASNVPHVKDAETLIVGPYVAVAIDIDEDLDDTRVGTVKYTVSEALQNDKYGKTAIVIAEANMTDRFREMQEKIKDGQPIQAVLDEMAEIVNRYMPTFPVEDQRDDMEKEGPNENNMPNENPINHQKDEAPVDEPNRHQNNG